MAQFFFFFQIKCYSFEFSIHQRILKKVLQVSQKKLNSTTVFNIVSWAPNQPIRMISEGSCDTEDYNDAENSSLISQEWITF